MSLRKYFSSFENEAVSDIDSPRDYLHIKILRFTLVIISSWPQKELGEPEPYYQIVILKYFYLVFTIACQIGCVTYITLHMRELNFFEAGLGYLTALMDAENLFRVISLTLSTKYRNVVKDFLTKTHLFYYKNGSEYAMKIHKMVHILSHLFTLFVVGQMTMGLILFNLIPMYNNYAAGKYSRGGVQNATFEHSLYYSYPFNFSTDVTGYTVACIINWFISYLCTSWFCMFDLILTLMVFHIWGHFKILINLLNDFPRPSTSSNFTLENGCVIQADIYSKEELLQVSKRLKDCINYHRAIVHFTEAVSDVFGPMLFSYYLFHQASGCLLLLECSQMTVAALVRYLPLSIILTQQLIQLSVIFELVGSESGKLKDAVYGVPWECMDCANRKLVKFFLMNVQEPVHLKALGVANVGVTSMAMILKTSISYFTLLRSI